MKTTTENLVCSVIGISIAIIIGMVTIYYWIAHNLEKDHARQLAVQIVDGGYIQSNEAELWQYGRISDEDLIENFKTEANAEYGLEIWNKVYMPAFLDLYQYAMVKHPFRKRMTSPLTAEGKRTLDKLLHKLPSQVSYSLGSYNNGGMNYPCVLQVRWSKLGVSLVGYKQLEAKYPCQ
jgi:hypothetical protein